MSIWPQPTSFVTRYPNVPASDHQYLLGLSGAWKPELLDNPQARFTDPTKPNQVAEAMFICHNPESGYIKPGSTDTTTHDKLQFVRHFCREATAAAFPLVSAASAASVEDAHKAFLRSFIDLSITHKEWTALSMGGRIRTILDPKGKVYNPRRILYMAQFIMDDVRHMNLHAQRFIEIRSKQKSNMTLIGADHKPMLRALTDQIHKKFNLLISNIDDVKTGIKREVDDFTLVVTGIEADKPSELAVGSTSTIVSSVVSSSVSLGTKLCLLSFFKHIVTSVCVNVLSGSDEKKMNVQQKKTPKSSTSTDKTVAIPAPSIKKNTVPKKLVAKKLPGKGMR